MKMGLWAAAAKKNDESLQNCKHMLLFRQKKIF